MNIGKIVPKKYSGKTIAINLDQKDWSRLAKTTIKVDKPAEEILVLLRRKVAKQEIIVLFSDAHSIEFHKYSNDEVRKEAGKLIQEFSKGIGFKSIEEIRDLEYENVFCELNQKPYSSQKEMFLKAVAANIYETFGHRTAAYQALLRSFPGLKNSFEQAINGLRVDELIEHMHSRRKMATEPLEKFVQGHYVADVKEIKERIQKEGKSQKEVEDIFYRGYGISLQSNVVGLFYKHFGRLLPPLDFVERMTERKSLERVPTIRNYIALFSADWRNSSQTQTPSSIWDISGLSVALTYCDIVSADARMADFCKQTHIDKNNGVTVIRKLEELKRLI